MVIVVPRMAIEVTRRCNLQCEFCMRGEAQNIDFDPSYVDRLFQNSGNIFVNLNFSGGEPTLNEDFIEYVIDKIIREKIIVLSIQMTTNGYVYSKRIVAALERFYDYVQKYFLPLQEPFEVERSVLIRISNDQYHSTVDKRYQQLSKNIVLEYTGSIDMLDDGVILAGRAKKNIPFGRAYQYCLEPIKIQRENKWVLFRNEFYFTASGFVTTVGDGEYADMDRINFGRIEDFSFQKLLGDDKPEEAQKLGYVMSSKKDFK